MRVLLGAGPAPLLGTGRVKYTTGTTARFNGKRMPFVRRGSGKVSHESQHPVALTRRLEHSCQGLFAAFCGGGKARRVHPSSRLTKGVFDGNALRCKCSQAGRVRRFRRGITFANHPRTRERTARVRVLAEFAAIDCMKGPLQNRLMGDAAKRIIEAFDALSASERQEVILELLRRASLVDMGFPRDDELVAAADGVFKAMDEREIQG